MTKEEFITIAQRCGYGTGKALKSMSNRIQKTCTAQMIWLRYMKEICTGKKSTRTKD